MTYGTRDDEGREEDTPAVHRKGEEDGENGEENEEGEEKVELDEEVL